MSNALEKTDPRRRKAVWRFFQAFFYPLFRIWNRFRAEGLEHLPHDGALLLLNHQSFLDPLYAAAALHRPVSYIARHNLFHVPLLGWLLRNTHVMPIRRDSAGAESIRMAVEQLQRGFYVGVFPEGTRGSSPTLQRIKPGFVAIARRSNVPVIPVGIAGSGDVLPRRGWFPRPHIVRVVYGEPFSPEEVARLSAPGNEAEFIAAVQERLQACVTLAEDWRQGRSIP